MHYDLNKENYKIESAFRNDFKIDINKNNEGKRHEIICESLKFTAVTCLCVGLLIPFYNKEPTKKDKITTWSALSSGVLISVTDILLYFHWKDDIKYYRANHKKH